MELKIPFSIGVFLVFLLSGCASQNPSRPPPLNPNFKYTVTTSEQETLHSVLGTPTSFLVHYRDNAYAWERAQLFFAQYTSGIKTEFSSGKTELVRLKNRETNDKYLYQVLREETPAGYKYQIACKPLTPSGENLKLAQRNAHNLARFIKEGNLELSILAR